MIQDGHTRKISIPVSANVGTTSIITAVGGAWIYIHELIGDLASPGDLTIRTGSTTVATFSLDAGQGITLQDNDGGSNVPRFECKPGDDFILVVTGGAFKGACQYSLRY